MHRVWGLFWVTALLLFPSVLAEEPQDAADIWTTQQGDDQVEAVGFQPLPVQAGTLPVASITFREGHNVTDVSGQYCRIHGPDRAVTPTCFRAGLESELQLDGRTWHIDLAAQGDEPTPIPVPEAGERLGVQFFVTLAGADDPVLFPEGLPVDHPWFSGTNEEFLLWDETQYFGFDVAGTDAQAASFDWWPWLVIGLLAAGAVVAFRLGSKGIAIALSVMLTAPAGFLVWGQVTEAAKAPDFTLTDTGWEDGEFRGEQEFSLSDLEGKTVVLDFMAYNCGSCRFVTNNVMDPLWEEYGHRDDFEILTIDVGEFTNFPGSTQENLIRWQTGNEPGIPAADWIHALDTEGIFLDYTEIGAIGLPSVFVVDGDRNVIFANSGTPNPTTMREIIDASFEGQAESVNVLTVGVLGLALVAGIASFFAPCSVGLIPAYMGFLLQRRDADGEHHSTIPAGLATAAGIVSLYGALAILLWIFQDFIGGTFRYIAPIIGGVLVLFGILLLFEFDWEPLAKRLGMGKVDGRRGFFAFGIGYGLAAFGCTGPIFLPVLVAGFTQGALIGFLAFAVYALAVASFVLFAAYLVGAGKKSRLMGLLSHTKGVMRFAAVLLILAGAYLIWFDLTAFGVF